ncbi:uncharacterized protein YlxW (UPF0749 family) [Sediminihabitans luteus]|uniref:Uncharacterized protein YlxW (UPF0749 family) n=1 Tax=Sediminihabitans luteus TaxID=1138585 RepID=A0A2M9CQM9_9CELL|nr:DUF881 domain-containing protein [Sediminihabitans luteus]PJJ74233.1 uncharacterized protein YlxW (UPF0749 family) [Sediminihabitans luteus]GII99086.1 membrane protein [Sediminihabitans luteus]
MTPHPPPSAPARERRPDESMTLLVETMERPLDPGYAQAARERAAGTRGPRRAVTSVWVALLAVVLGFGTAVAARALNAPEPSALAARTLLEDEIASRQAEADALTARVDALDDEVDALGAQALSEEEPALLASLEADGVLSGSVAVSGPGLVVTLRDASGFDDAQMSSDSRVQDDDLQIVVNSLWASGAEAVAVNGRRLTALSAIRTAGDAILVDLQPLSSPYRVVAIGDPGSLKADFTRSVAGGYLVTLTNYGIQSSVVGQSSLEVPADASLRLYHAVPVDSPTAAPEESSTTPSARNDEEQGSGR